jgi:hypothetical protein
MFGLLLLFSYCLISIDGHGYLYEPVARSSAWLVDSSFKQCCTYPQHMEMFCGGLGHQWRVNGLPIFLKKILQYSICSLYLRWKM